MSGITLTLEWEDLRIEEDISKQVGELSFLCNYLEWEGGNLVATTYSIEGYTDDIEDDLAALWELGVRGEMAMRAPEYHEQWKYRLTDSGVFKYSGRIVYEECGTWIH